MKRTAEADGCCLRMYGPNDLPGRANPGGLEEGTTERWFQNVNTPSELAAAEALAEQAERQPDRR